MKSISAIAIVSAAILGGCASLAPSASVEDSGSCKVGPGTLTSVTGVQKLKPVNSLDQAYAQMQLGTSNFRFGQLIARGPVNNLTENVMQGCVLEASSAAS